ncbi:MAG: hypothetical protein JOZ94_14790 [Xanthobacteraceae bacterium]|nr:hypothetical protein [Xanthobacteraceae bacterium]MBV9237096.1 hypothetical protein [Xanthobacteraceae bacterium]MBV9629938.1 hypothetical protein [Xanthobacteraceae bacterium]
MMDRQTYLDFPTANLQARRSIPRRDACQPAAFRVDAQCHAAQFTATEVHDERQD